MSLLLDLPDRDLSDVSIRRVQAAVRQTALSLSTLQANRHIAIGAQAGIADAIRASPSLRALLNWQGRPGFVQLSAACQLIFDHIDQGRSLKGYHVFDGQQLAAVLTKLASNPIKSFVAERVVNRRLTETVSDSVETSLRFMRKYVGHAFSRHLMAVQFIHNDLTSRMGQSPTADYGFYAAWAESLFMEAGLAALDEYGIPPHTVSG